MTAALDDYPPPTMVKQWWEMTADEVQAQLQRNSEAIVRALDSLSPPAPPRQDHSQSGEHDEMFDEPPPEPPSPWIDPDEPEAETPAPAVATPTPEPKYDPDNPPWRDRKPAPRSEDVIPGTVYDRSARGFDYGDEDEDDDEAPARRRDPKPPRRSAREWVEEGINRWSGWTPRTKLMAGTVAGLMSVGLLVSMCGHSEPAIKTNNNAGNAPSAPLDTSASPDQEPGTLIPKTVKDFCPKRSTHATLAFTGNAKNAWVCMRAHNSDGARFEIYFDSPVVITGITVVPGWNYVEPNGKNHWGEHRLVTKILWRLGGQQLVQEINPVPGGATLSVKNIATVSMSGTIQSTIQPPESNTDNGPFGGIGNDKKVNESFAIGSVTITGYPAGSRG